MALGATRGTVLGMVLGQGLRLTLVGLAVGLAAAFGLTRLLQAQLFNVKPTDPATIAVGCRVHCARRVGRLLHSRQARHARGSDGGAAG